MKKIWAVGDAATGGTDAAKVAAMIANDMPDAFPWLGDVYESGTANEFAVNYKPSWGAMDEVVRPCPGNHDWPNHATGYGPYFASRTAGNTFYKFSLDGWDVFMFNSEELADPSSAQYKWFAGLTLDISHRRRIACWHRPRYCSGSHGDATDMDPLWQLVAPHCAVILGGHAHNMQHFKPDATGCVQLVSGAGGRSLYAEIPNDPRLEWGNASGYGAVRLLLTDSSCDISWFDETSKQLYSSTVGVT